MKFKKFFTFFYNIGAFYSTITLIFSGSVWIPFFTIIINFKYLILLIVNSYFLGSKCKLVIAIHLTTLRILFI